jgi:plastocyanin
MSGTNVLITNAGFAPDPVEIQAGDMIVWTNQTMALQDATSADDGVTFRTGPLPSGSSSLPITLPDPGSIPYRSSQNPSLQGTVVVAGSSNPTE